MKILNKFKQEIARISFCDKYNKNINANHIKPFDDDFYSQFEGMYYNGLPIYYYLKELNMGQCYDASAILALALCNLSPSLAKETHVCRGELSTMSKIINDCFGHGWVEVGDKVLDTTWQIIADKDVYYEVFKVKDPETRRSDIFFEDCKELSDWSIHDKTYYETNFVPMLNTTILLVNGVIELELKNPNLSAEKRVLYLKLQQDLPDYEKMRKVSPPFTFGDSQPLK